MRVVLLLGEHEELPPRRGGLICDATICTSSCDGAQLLGTSEAKDCEVMVSSNKTLASHDFGSMNVSRLFVLLWLQMRSCIGSHVFTRAERSVLRRPPVACRSDSRTEPARMVYFACLCQSLRNSRTITTRWTRTAILGTHACLAHHSKECKCVTHDRGTWALAVLLARCC